MTHGSRMVVALALVSAAAQASELAPDLAPDRGVVPPASSFACAVDLKPDTTVISGAVTAESVRPTAAKAQLERQLAELRKYAASVGGELALQEAVRTVTRNEPPVPDAQPFRLLQRLEIAFPASVEIDPILEQVLQLGLDRYGDDIGLYGYSGEPQPVVRYRFAHAGEAVKTILQGCRQQALAEWCHGNARSSEAALRCDAAGGTTVPLRIEQLYLQSQPVYQSPQNLLPITLAYPLHERALREVLLLGNVTLKFAGSVSISFPPP